VKLKYLPTWTPETTGVISQPPRFMPFPMTGRNEEKTPEGLSPFPLEFSLSEAVELWWRVRSFKASYENVPVFGDGELELLVSDFQNDNSEKSRVRPANFQWFGEIEVDPANYLRFTVGICLPKSGFIIPLQPTDFDGPSYYIQPRTSTSTATVVPSMYIYMNYSVYDGDETGELLTVEIPSATGLLTWDFCGQAIDANQLSTIDYPINLSVTKNSYWSYGGTWNESTGEKILTS
jgi:hypothetical protein